MGRELGRRYELLEEIGEGSLATVWRGRDRVLGCERAVKVLPPAWSAFPELLKRFQREARTMANLDHPNIVTVHDVGVDGGTAFLVMELLSGGSLREQGTVELPKAVHWLDQVLWALGDAHARGAVHRDVRPANLMLSRHGLCKLTDFGLVRVLESATQSGAKLTAAGQGLGQWPWAAPEQLASGSDADPRSDVYSVGATLFGLLTGRKPADMFYQPADVEDLPDAVGAFILKATAFQAGDRFSSATSMRRALRKL